MERYEEKICRYAFNRIFGFKPRTTRLLIEEFGSAAKAFEECCRMNRQKEQFIGKSFSGINEREYENATAELRDLENKGIVFLPENHKSYPSLLRQCDDRPAGLYVKSEDPVKEIFSAEKKYFAFVGTRDFTSYGREWCERLIESIAESGGDSVIVSGLAGGIDITAHRKALSCGIPTIAVLPTGIDRIYPYRHLKDAEKIYHSRGSALVSDYPPKTVPLAINFLRRNRIIAGMSNATVLVESKIKGGGMMTAHLAFSYDREVYAVPGRMDDLRSQGCNDLIANKIAEAISSEDKFLESLGLKRDKKKEKKNEQTIIHKRYKGQMNDGDIELMSRILLCIKQERDIEMDKIVEICNVEYRKVAELSALLECDGLIRIDMMRRCSINTK